MDDIKTLARWIEECEKITFLTGAGFSVPSGIPDFRGTEGRWKEESEKDGGKNISRETYISEGFYNASPKKFWGKYKKIFDIKLAGNYEPNEAHEFITELSKNGKEVHVLTQNVDGLHTKALNPNVIEIHGTLKVAHCPKCKRVYDLDYILKNEIPRCNREASKGHCNFILKPDVVLYGGAIRGFNEAEKILDETELLIVAGTSLEVGPVNTLPRYFRYVMNDWETNEPKMAIISLEPTKKDNLFPVVIHRDIVETVKLLKEEMKRL